MKRLVFLIIIFNNSLLFSQSLYNFKLYYQKKEDTISLLMDNQDPFPYSFEFFERPKGKNLRSVGENFNNQLFIEGNTYKKLLAKFVPLDRNKPFNIKDISFFKVKEPFFRMTVGNIWKAEYDSDYIYDLPFASREMFMVMQGYNGDYSHRNQNALDFQMSEGTEILAARSGYVIDIKQDGDRGCPDKACAKYGNYVKIIHSDGTIAEYYHLKINSSKVKLGDSVETGEVIALSGNTGYSTEPHLHFMCYLPRSKSKNISIKTLFRINNGKDSKYLISGNKYKRNY